MWLSVCSPFRGKRFTTINTTSTTATITHQQNGWKSVNLAQPFSSTSVAAGWQSGLPQAEKPTPAAGALEFTSPKLATQPEPEEEKVRKNCWGKLWISERLNTCLSHNKQHWCLLLTLGSVRLSKAQEGIKVFAVVSFFGETFCFSSGSVNAGRSRSFSCLIGCLALGWLGSTKSWTYKTFPG